MGFDKFMMHYHKQKCTKKNIYKYYGKSHKFYPSYMHYTSIQSITDFEGIHKKDIEWIYGHTKYLDYNFSLSKLIISFKAIPCGRRNTEYFLGGLSGFWHKYSVFRRIQFLEPYGKHRQLTEYIRRSRHS